MTLIEHLKEDCHDVFCWGETRNEIFHQAQSVVSLRVGVANVGYIN
jgi:hypothetical protein